MRKYELRIYTLDSPAALEQFSTVNYPRHLDSFPTFGIRPEGFFRAADPAAEPKLYVLVSFDEDADPAQIGAEFMQSPELARDLEGFDHQRHIVRVESEDIQREGGIGTDFEVRPLSTIADADHNGCPVPACPPHPDEGHVYATIRTAGELNWLGCR